jgi:RNA polymerase sigma-70 factor (ECF subfamily)
VNDESTDLDVLMARLADGDRAAFAPVFRLLWPRVSGLCLSLMRERADADDAAQTAMERILARASEYDPKRPALPWALGVAAWECRTLKRRRERRREVSEDVAGTEPSATADSTEGELLERDLLRAALEAMGQLAESDQATLIATFNDEALKADVSGAAQRKRRQRAIERLRAAFRRIYGFD